MASRMKEDEKNEKIIRGLLKLPPNRRCINCNSLGPQYVCTNFWTFVCTTCSGIHREFTHRVKSVSMAKFTSQEVCSLQEGGNERARVIYFKEWDPQRQSAPDSSNVDRLRDFIKHVYVDRRYTGERGVEKPPRVKMGEKDESYENRRFDTYRGSSQSPSYEDRYDRNYSDRSSLGGRTDDRNYRYNYDERRSPGYDQEPRYGDYRKSPGQFEVDDRRRDDRFGNGRRSEESRFSDGESRFDGRSPNRQKDVDTSSPPLVRPVRDILGEDAPPLRISGPPKPNDGKVADGCAKTQRTASSSSFGSVDTSSIDLKGGNSGSLIDFDADPEPPATTAAPPATRPTTSVVQSIPQPSATASSDGGNWASFDFTPQASVQTQIQASVLTQTQAPSGNTLESLLSQLSAPATASVGFQTAGSGAPTVATVSDGAQTVVGNASLHINGGFTASPAGNVSTVPSSGGASVAAPGGVTSLPVAVDHGGQWSNTQQNQPSLLPANSMPIANQFTPSVGGAPNNQSWNSSFMQNVHGPLNATAQQSQAASRSIQETTGVSALQPAPSEIKTTGRKELPEDLFAANYSAVRMPVPHWHAGMSPGMGYGMQYPTAMPMHVMPMQMQQTQSFPRPLKPTNPFDLNSEPTLGHAQSFPSMTSLQGALPNVAAPLGLVHSSSLGAMPSQWLPTQSPSLASAMPPSAYMGQQLHTNVQVLGHQGSSGFGSNAASFGTINSDPQMGGRYSLPATPNSFSSAGGNPFG